MCEVHLHAVKNDANMHGHYIYSLKVTNFLCDSVVFVLRQRSTRYKAIPTLKIILEKILVAFSRPSLVSLISTEEPFGNNHRRSQINGLLLVSAPIISHCHIRNEIISPV